MCVCVCVCVWHRGGVGLCFKIPLYDEFHNTHTHTVPYSGKIINDSWWSVSQWLTSTLIIPVGDHCGMSIANRQRKRRFAYWWHFIGTALRGAVPLPHSSRSPSCFIALPPIHNYRPVAHPTVAQRVQCFRSAAISDNSSLMSWSLPMKNHVPHFYYTHMCRCVCKF